MGSQARSLRSERTFRVPGPGVLCGVYPHAKERYRSTTCDGEPAETYTDKQQHVQTNNRQATHASLTHRWDSQRCMRDASRMGVLLPKQQRIRAVDVPPGGSAMAGKFVCCRRARGILPNLSVMLSRGTRRLAKCAWSRSGRRSDNRTGDE